jgi:cation-transporting ATPase I
LLAEANRSRRRGGRRVWHGGERIHIELRRLTPQELDAFAPELESRLCAVAGVRWARVNRWLGAVVVGCEQGRGREAAADDGKRDRSAARRRLQAQRRQGRGIGPSADAADAAEPAQAALEQRLLQAVEALERAHCYEARRFPNADDPERHPGDPMPLLRALFELGTDVLATAAAGRGRRKRHRNRPLLTDLAALVDMAANVPGLRAAVERYLGPALAELGFELSSATLQVLLNSETGAATHALYRTLKLRAARARRSAWECWEERLCGDADTASGTAAAVAQPATPAAPGTGGSDAAGARPRTLPDGPIERHLAQVLPSALGAFTGAFIGNHRSDEAAAAIFAGVPRAARFGRNAFAAEAGLRLAQQDVMVMVPGALRRLDRLDTVLVSDALLREDSQAARHLSDCARRCGLECVRVGTGDGDRDGGDGDDQSTGGLPSVRRIEGSAMQALSILHGEGRGVLFLHRGADAAHAMADCSLACRDGSGPPAWGAHLHAEGGLAQAAAMIELVAAARCASEQAARLGLLEAAFDAVLAAKGLSPEITRQVVLASNVASVLALINSVRCARRVAWPQPGSEAQAAEPPQVPAWHALDVEQVLQRLGSRRGGLTAAEAKRRHRSGPRPPGPVVQALHALREELRNPMTPMLLAGATLSLLAGAPVDAALIAAVLAIDGGYGGWQRLHAQRITRELSRRGRETLCVRREDRRVDLDSDALVPGDIVELKAGDAVPADCRIVDAASLEVDESSLTGESLPVAKSGAPTSAEHIAERRSTLYAGTAVAAGTVTAVVVAVGADTETGRAAAPRQESPESAAGAEAHLSRLTELSLPLAGGAAAILAVVARHRGSGMQEALGTAAGLAVAAVPEGLPLLAGVAQAAAAERLSRRGTLVRNPRAVEALGRIDVLCCDKTGTLTEGRIRLKAVSDGREARDLDALGDAQRQVIAVALRASPPAGDREALAHSTDRALIDAARELGVGSHDALQRWQRLDEMPFQSDRAYQADLAAHRDGKLISVKGAPEIVLQRCSHWRRNSRSGSRARRLDRRTQAQLAAEAQRLARQGYRILAVAERPAHERRPIDDERVRNLSFCGFLAFADPVRSSARAAVEKLQRAGIRVVMLTGDHADTAAAIADTLALDHGRTLSGGDIDRLGDEALQRAATSTAVFARVTPSHKVRIVQALQRCGSVVAMTGDGANDAPAIRLAEVGIAVGANATHAAREAADLVVSDGRIDNLVAAVSAGRALWRSLRDAATLIVGGNLGEVLFTLGAGLGGDTAPLNARQLLLLNLLSDTAPALALALRERPEAAEMLARTGVDIAHDETLTREIGLRAGVTAGSAGIAWTAARLTGRRRGAGTVALLALTGTQLLQSVMMARGDRGVRRSALLTAAGMLAVVETPGVSRLFGCRPLGPLGLLQAALGASCGAAAQRLLPRPRAADRGQAEAASAGAPQPAERSAARHQRRTAQAAKKTRAGSAARSAESKRRAAPHAADAGAARRKSHTRSAATRKSRRPGSRQTQKAQHRRRR